VKKESFIILTPRLKRIVPGANATDDPERLLGDVGEGSSG
jgi:hypothetical protein